MKAPARTLLVLLAVFAGASAALVGNPKPPPATDEIAPLELAQWIRDRRPGVVVVDARPPEAMIQGRLPGARSTADFKPGIAAAAETIVVYADRQVHAGAVAALCNRSRSPRVLRLQGGLEAWNEEVLYPVIRADASARQRRAFTPRAQLSRYFGGSPRVLEPGAAVDRSRSRRGC